MICVSSPLVFLLHAFPLLLRLIVQASCFTMGEHEAALTSDAEHVCREGLLWSVYSVRRQQLLPPSSLTLSLASSFAHCTPFRVLLRASRVATWAAASGRVTRQPGSVSVAIFPLCHCISAEVLWLLYFLLSHTHIHPQTHEAPPASAGCLPHFGIEFLRNRRRNSFEYKALSPESERKSERDAGKEEEASKRISSQGYSLRRMDS